MSASFERYNRIVDFYPAQWPLIVPGYLPILNAMLDVVRVRGWRPREILDLGCGPGSATVAVAQACDPEGAVTLVDGAPDMVGIAKRLVQTNVRQALVADFTDPSFAGQIFPAGHYDIVLASFALHHLADAQKRETIDHIATSLRPGGFCLLADEVAVDRPAQWDLVASIRARFVEGHLQAGHIDRRFLELESTLPEEHRLPFRPARVEDLTSWLARAGLAVSCPMLVLGSALLVGVKPG